MVFSFSNFAAVIVNYYYAKNSYEVVQQLQSRRFFFSPFMYSLAPTYPDLLLSKAAVVDGLHSPVSDLREMRCWRRGAVLGI